MIINLMMWKIYLLKMSWMNLGYLKQTSMHEIYFVSHLAMHIGREQTSLFFGEVLCASQKNKKSKKYSEKKIDHKGSQELWDWCAWKFELLRRININFVVVDFFWTRATDFTEKKGLLNLLLNNTFKKYPHLKITSTIRKTKQKTYEFLAFTR